jgi:hypothetical protein
MLTAHVDIEVLTDAKKRFELDPYSRPRDFIDLVNKNSHLVWYGDPSEDEYRLLSQMLAGRGDSLIKHGIEPTCADKVPDQKDPFQLFFASRANYTEETESGFFTSSLDNYEDKFNELIKNSYLRLGDPESDSKFKNWKELDSDIFVSDVILVDTYAVSAADENILENNLYSLARLFKAKDTLRSFLIFTRKPGLKDKDKNIPLFKIVQKLREILGTKVTTGVIYFEKFSNEHDRHLIMNYRYINAGNSFSSVYDANGSVITKNASTISILPLTDLVSFRKMKEILSLMKKSLDAYHEKTPGAQKIKSRLFYCLEKP